MGDGRDRVRPCLCFQESPLSAAGLRNGEEAASSARSRAGRKGAAPQWGNRQNEDNEDEELASPKRRS